MTRKKAADREATPAEEQIVAPVGPVGPVGPVDTGIGDPVAIDPVLAGEIEHLASNLRDALLTHVRSMQDPWAKLSEVAQSNKIDAIEQAARTVVRSVALVVARQGFDGMPVRIKDFTVKDGVIKGKFESTMTADHIVLLGDHQGGVAQLVLADSEQFMHGPEAKAEPDQAELPIEEDGEGDPDDDASGEPERKAA